MATATDTWMQLDPESGFDVLSVMTRWSASQRAVAARTLQMCQQTAGEMADAHVESARALGIPAVLALAEAHASLSRELADAYVSSIQQLLDR